MYALIDCNNFFVSCERVFRPERHNKPVAVLSNNDGCIVSRSNEVKALGVPMGAPYFKVRHIIDKHNVRIFSANFQLYRDFSQRVMKSIRLMHPEMKQYSVDEAFLYLPNKSITELTEYCRDIYTNIIQWTNIPVSLGIGHTKTQAKLANFVGKKLHENQSVVHFDTISDEMLQQIPVGEIWGIGRALQKRLTSYLNIHTVYDFMRKDKIWIKNTLKSHGLAPYLELHGVPCTKERKQNFPKSIISSRSFGQPIESKADLKHAIASFVHTACYKLHKSKSRCQYINLYITSNRFRTDQQQYKNSMGISLPAPTNSIPELLNYADLLLDQIYKPGILYKKARILLAEITSEEHLQTDLFKKTSHEQDVLMDVYNTLNKKHGKNTVYFAAQGIAPKWRPRNAHQSPAYTTRWSDLPIVKAN